ncbi:MAG TPA: acyl-ACP--UDP-N-acetylglucosamine O-acyltransferase [Thioalkalivibrio sp.]|nr:acyl-ACP--UDP-N-acetylglucosamine O-acyltransferase [Thioalkalivibrio sp.]
MIHPTAIIDPGAELAATVSVGPYSVIGADVIIYEGTTIGPHVVIQGPTRIGRDNRIFQFCSLGEEPQDKKYRGEPTELVIGDRNVIREYCTFNRGSVQGTGSTSVGSDNWIMAYVHIAHECTVGDDTVFANGASLAGHVHVEDCAILGGFTLVHQFVRVGAYSFSGMGSGLLHDLPPYVMVSGNPAQPHGLNTEGLHRRGFDKDRIARLRWAYRTLYRDGLRLEEAIAELETQGAHAEIRRLIDFLKHSKRSIVR